MADDGWHSTTGSPLFQEWLELAGTGAPAQHTPLGEGDALIIVDMQADFLPRDSVTNPHGGRFGVAEGDHCTGPICHMIAAAAGAGSMIVATRDYHPFDHVSFLSQGGPFPSHCVQGTKPRTASRPREPGGEHLAAHLPAVTTP